MIVLALLLCIPPAIEHEHRGLLKHRAASEQPPVRVTVAEMLAWPDPAGASDKRVRASQEPIDEHERTVYVLEGVVELVRREKDCDLHIELSEGASDGLRESASRDVRTRHHSAELVPTVRGRCGATNPMQARPVRALRGRSTGQELPSVRHSERCLRRVRALPQTIIVEIPGELHLPRVRRGDRVRVVGWGFFDGAHTWQGRATPWELHPVWSVKKLSDPLLPHRWRHSWSARKKVATRRRVALPPSL